jgi:hypothetical protein
MRRKDKSILRMTLEFAKETKKHFAAGGDRLKSSLLNNDFIRSVASNTLSAGGRGCRL